MIPRLHYPGADLICTELLVGRNLEVFLFDFLTPRSH